MTIDVIKFGFIAGEVAETYYGRADLEKFDLAMAEAENWFVDYHGGLSNVQGTVFVDFIQNDTSPVKVFEFNFSSSIYDKYAILMGKNYIRFIQDGSYVLEAAKTVSSVVFGSVTQFNISAHGFTTGDWVQIISVGNVPQLVNRTCQIVVNSSSNFTILNTDGNNINSSSYPAYTGGITLGRVYTLSNPYSEFDIPNVKAHQIRDVLRFTHPSYEIRNLRRFSNANWSLTVENFSNLVPTTTITDTNKTTSGVYAGAYAVTVVNKNGQESLPSDYAIVTNTIDLLNPITEVSDDGTKGNDTVYSAISIKFNPVAGADYYKIYRSRFVRRMTSSADEYNIGRSYQLGYIGRSKGATFTDTGITPDFTETPPVNTNPLTAGAIKYINVTASGNFSRLVTMTVTDPTGSGFIGYPIVHVNWSQTTGPVVGILILDGGKNYTNPTITLSAAGTFTYTVELSPLTGVNPSVGTVFQQRQIYAGTNNAPLTVYGTKPGQLSDFTTSVVLVADDAFQHEIDSQNFSPILHLTDTRGGLLVMSAGGIWLMTGGEGKALTATSVQADTQVFTGTSDVPPIKIDTDLIYTASSGGRVNALAYADQYKLYAPTDISILANHLVRDAKIINWTYANEPHRIIYAVRDDGVMLMLTYIKDQEVYAWTRRVTRGEYKYVVSFEGEKETDVYLIVERKLNGRYKKVIERLASRSFETVEDAVFLDCALTLGKNYPNANIEISAAAGTAINVVADAAIFSSGDVGSILRFGNGKARVVQFVSSSSIVVSEIRAFDELLHATSAPRRAKIGEWTLDKEVTIVTGLWHLEGQTVNVLADGNVIKNVVVSGGTVSLPQAASRVAIGIPYAAKAKNLPLTIPGDVIEAKNKRVVNLAVRLHETSGIMVGNRLSDLYSPRMEVPNFYGEPNPLFTGITHILVEPLWGDDAQSYFVQEAPLPATILGYVVGADIGD
jgi:hypothetical protein